MTEWMRRAALAAAPAVLAGCSAPAEPDQAATQSPAALAAPAASAGALPTTGLNRFSRQLAEMGTAEREETFARLMVGSGEDCAAPTDVAVLGSSDGTDMWRITCAGTDMVVSIAPDSSTKILECSTLKALGTDCRKPWS